MHGAHEVVGSNPAGPTSIVDAQGARARRDPMAGGILPLQALNGLVAEGRVTAAHPFTPRQLQPASLDLRLGARAWRVRASFLPGPDATVRERLRHMSMHEIDLTRSAVLEIGCVYVAELQEAVALPEAVRGLANAKSTTGRLDVFTRLIADNCSEFDRLPAGYAGPLHAEISPRTFSLLVREGSRLNQLRFSRGNPAISGSALRALNSSAPVAAPDSEIDATGLRFSVDLQSRDGAPVGWRAKRHCGLVDIDRAGAYPAEDFWDPVFAEGGELTLDPGAFYILVSREAVRVPPGYAAEMTPYLPFVGEFRVHYAGFFDPGFGFGLAGDRGARSVLEVRCHETPFVLRHGQIVGRLVFEEMLEAPDTLYGDGSGSSYQGQGLQLAKHFR